MDNWIDILSLIVSIVTAALVPSVYWLYKRWADGRQKQTAQEQAAKDDETRRLQEQHDAAAAEQHAAVERKHREYEELKEIFAIHSALTQLDAFAALERVRASPQALPTSAGDALVNVDVESAKLFLISLHFRTTSQFTRLQENIAVPQEIIDKIDEIQGEIAKRFPSETRATQALFTEQRNRVQGHEKNPEVQARVLQIASRFAGRPVAIDTVVEVAPEFRDLMGTLRITRAGQGISFTLPDTDTSIWFAGNGQGMVPATVEHGADRALRACSLRSRKRGSLLTQLQQIPGDADIATALAGGIRALALENDNICGCGEPLTFAMAPR